MIVEITMRIDMISTKTGRSAWKERSVLSVLSDRFPRLEATRERPTDVTTITIGTGIETMLWGNWFARGEYRYADFGTGSFSLSRTGAPPDAGLTNYDVRVRTHTALFGIAYKFGDAGAVIAKY